MNELIIKENETIDQFLWRQGSQKEQGSIHLTWPEQTQILNDADDSEEQYSESYWRKKYRQMRLDRAAKEDESIANMPGLVSFFTQIEKQRIRAKDERITYTRALREQARQDAILELFQETISSFVPAPPTAECEKRTTYIADKAIYAMLSDIHYGISFNSYAGKYDSSVARMRVMQYADEIIRIGRLNNVKDCYLSLMGDLISGIIHTTIRIENRENLIEQVVGVSEQISDFIAKQSTSFENVYVNSVDGNHSRVDASADDALRAEKMDALIPWYCKTKQQFIDNVFFQENELDSSIGSFSIFGKTYVSVHGDMDSDLKNSVQRIEQMMHDQIDYMLAGHMHVAETRIENTGYIRNGSVCGSGDEYTIKKRLFGPPVQVCMIVSASGVEAIHPIKL